MMTKLMKPLLIILIGLNSISCDPDEAFERHFYLRNISNQSSENVLIVGYNKYNEMNDTLMIASKTSYNLFGRVNSDNAKEGILIAIIEENVNDISEDVYENLELYSNDDVFIKEWVESPNYYGNQVNSPYNYDSWSIITYEEVIRDGFDITRGEIIFTITDGDLE